MAFALAVPLDSNIDDLICYYFFQEASQITLVKAGSRESSYFSSEHLLLSEILLYQVFV